VERFALIALVIASKVFSLKVESFNLFIDALLEISISQNLSFVF